MESAGTDPKQNNPPMQDCIFCRIASGQIKAKVVYQDQQVVAFRDINPQAPVHILIIPKKHIERFSLMREEDFPLLQDIHRAAQIVAKSENLIQEGFRIVTNEGKNGGQSVEHLHYHVLGGRPLSWPPG